MNIVSGFIGGVNHRPDRDISKYISLGQELIDAEFPITLFLEKSVFDTLDRGRTPETSAKSWSYNGRIWKYVEPEWRRESDPNSDPNSGQILVVFFDKEDLYLWNFRHLASDFWVKTENPDKDSLDYFTVQLQKFEWMRMAVALHREKDLFDWLDRPYAWIDFGIRHVFGKEDMLPALLAANHRLEERRFGCPGAIRRGTIRCASCIGWEPEKEVVWALDIYRHVKWVFAGGVFVGHASDIEKLAGIFYERCFRILIEHKTIMWEVNVLALIYRDKPDMFDLYSADHNASIICNM